MTVIQFHVIKVDGGSIKIENPPIFRVGCINVGSVGETFDK
jgi:hypothetical protein